MRNESMFLVKQNWQIHNVYLPVVYLTYICTTVVLSVVLGLRRIVKDIVLIELLHIF